MEISVYATLRTKTGAKSVYIENVTQITAGEIIKVIFQRYPQVHNEVTTSNGNLHSAFHFFVNGRDVQYINGLDTVVTDKDDVRIFPPVGGGGE